LGKKAPAQTGNFCTQYTVFYTSYIHKFMECSFTDHLSQLNNFWNLISLLIIIMVSCLFVSMWEAKGYFCWNGNFFLEIGKNAPYLASGIGPTNGPVRLAEKAGLAKCRQIWVFSMPAVFTGKYRYLLANTDRLNL
jgi:hypothetical protein